MIDSAHHTRHRGSGRAAQVAARAHLRATPGGRRPKELDPSTPRPGRSSSASTAASVQRTLWHSRADPGLPSARVVTCCSSTLMGTAQYAKIVGEDGYRALVRTSFTASFYQVGSSVSVCGRDAHASRRLARGRAPTNRRERGRSGDRRRSLSSQRARPLSAGKRRADASSRVPPSLSRSPPRATRAASGSSRGWSSAFDGSPESRLALDSAEELTQQSDADLTVYSVHSPPAFGDVGVGRLFSRESASQALRAKLEREQREALAGRSAPGPRDDR